MTKPVALVLSLKLNLEFFQSALMLLKRPQVFGTSTTLNAESFLIFNSYHLAFKFALDLNSFGLFNSVSAAKITLTFEMISSLQLIYTIFNQSMALPRCKNL